MSRSEQRELSTVRYSSEDGESSQPSLHLVIAHSPDANANGRDVSLLTAAEAVLPIGRDIAPPGLCVKDARMSRLHFRIVWNHQDQIHHLGDANSANGTYLNGKRVATSPIEPGDVIRAGDTSFVIDAGDTMTAVRKDVALVAASPNTVLLLGESGTGKEVLARSLHEGSDLSGNFIPVNCAAIPKDLVAAELFGHTRGAFSGAAIARQGLFMAAAGGSLFLDEVADLPLEVQPALLRALQEKRIRPVGAERETECSARIIAATHVDLLTACDAGRFRHDLYARLSGFTFTLPPLRARRREIIPLFYGFCKRNVALSANTAEALLLWNFPGNVRELAALASAFEVFRPQDTALGIEFLKARQPAMSDFLQDREPSSTPPRKRSAAPRQLASLLSEHAWNISAVAQALNCSRVQIYRWIKAYGLSRPDTES
ncbi:MAG TPA: sigma 54-interacting transcriptional regulator [Polyangiaceae bacterium]|nr:sigma 54-interacting transcriptional regulator [Polyangiaceae bacterium]